MPFLPFNYNRIIPPKKDNYIINLYNFIMPKEQISLNRVRNHI